MWREEIPVESNMSINDYSLQGLFTNTDCTEWAEWPYLHSICNV